MRRHPLRASAGDEWPPPRVRTPGPPPDLTPGSPPRTFRSLDPRPPLTTPPSTAPSRRLPTPYFLHHTPLPSPDRAWPPAVPVGPEGM
ncbi:hypothetical protein JCM18899A_10210 [Nocardioides sp. AN3]